MMSNLSSFIFCVIMITLSSCQRVPDTIDPQIKCMVNDEQFRNLDPAFPALTHSEKQQEWGKEYQIGIAFAKDLDFYRAITALKRASILIPEDFIFRKAEIQYYIVLNYYLGGRYQEAIDTFDQSELSHVSETFPAYKDLLLVLYECFYKTDQAEKSEFILRLLEQKDQKTHHKLLMHKSLVSADLKGLIASTDDKYFQMEFKSLAEKYKKEKKSPFTAQTLNAVLPGAGFLYVGQKQTALTSFCLNGLFIAAAAHFFSKGNIAAGLITTSFEAGWYFGGIYGAGEAAKLYNERKYETNTSKYMNQKKLFPILMLEHAF